VSDKEGRDKTGQTVRRIFADLLEPMRSAPKGAKSGRKFHVLAGTDGSNRMGEGPSPSEQRRYFRLERREERVKKRIEGKRTAVVHSRGTLSTCRYLRTLHNEQTIDKPIRTEVCPEQGLSKDHMDLKNSQKAVGEPPVRGAPRGKLLKMKRNKTLNGGGGEERRH